MNIGNNIKQLRQQMDFTQEQVAQRLGVSYQAVSKWENNANTPDIALLPGIASLFGVSIDALFAENILEFADVLLPAKDDDIIRIVQMRGTKVIKVTPRVSSDDPPIEIVFPRNCNDRSQYFKVEVYGHVVSDGSINGDVVCHQSIHCGEINGDVKSDGDIKVSELNSFGSVVCNNLIDCHNLQAQSIACAGSIHATQITCDEIS